MRKGAKRKLVQKGKNIEEPKAFAASANEAPPAKTRPARAKRPKVEPEPEYFEEKRNILQVELPTVGQIAQDSKYRSSQLILSQILIEKVTSFGRIPIRASELPIPSSPSSDRLPPLPPPLLFKTVRVRPSQLGTRLSGGPIRLGKWGVVDDDQRLNHRDWKKRLVERKRRWVCDSPPMFLVMMSRDRRRRNLGS
ncbi:hypothetical protein LINPERHAP2_LOCUS32120 [Linum perenne]